MNNLLSNEQAAEYLGVTKGTLHVWRSVGRYQIPFAKIGRYVKYKQSDLDAFIESQTMTQTTSCVSRGH